MAILFDVSQKAQKNLEKLLGRNNWHNGRDITLDASEKQHKRIVIVITYHKSFSAAALACVASVSVRFRSKEWGTRVKDGAKNGASKRTGRCRGRKEGNACRQTPRSWKMPTWPVMMPEFTHRHLMLSTAVICLSFRGVEMNFRGAYMRPKYFFCILERMDGVNGEISMNANDQCRSKVF